MKTREFYQIRKETAGSEQIGKSLFLMSGKLNNPMFLLQLLCSKPETTEPLSFKRHNYVVELTTAENQSTHISKNKFMKDSIKHSVLDVSSILSKAVFALFLLLSLTVCHQRLFDTEHQAKLSVPIWWHLPLALLC